MATNLSGGGGGGHDPSWDDVWERKAIGEKSCALDEARMHYFYYYNYMYLIVSKLFITASQTKYKEWMYECKTLRQSTKESEAACEDV